jgi:cation diffusion facilitator CzcD-associated flavoprotein CzcO
VSMTVSTGTTPEPTATRPLDVLIVGAGISGIGTAYHLKTKLPTKDFLVLEGREAIGGTWDLFRYPGIRSDSDLQTFSYAFKPWTHRKSIASADIILDYLNETIEENDLARHIRFGRQVTSAEYSSGTGLWTVTTRRADTGETETLTTRFLFSGTGYYDYRAGHTPEFPGIEDFGGQVVHPQHWPEDLDHTGKRVVVIGSGATAVTIVPAMADTAEHVTMLQRSPSYVFSRPAEDPVANLLNRLIGAERAYPIVRRKNIFWQRAIYRLCQRYPGPMGRMLISGARKRLPEGFDVRKHFTPNYGPWDQRMCLVPDGDLFAALSSGKASVATDRIERFTPTGIRLASGEHLDADIVVTATGLNLRPLGGIELRVDGQPVDLPTSTIYKSMMLSGVPNFAFAFGYTNSSWTLKVDIVCEHLCRLLEYMDAEGHTRVVPGTPDPAMPKLPLMDLSSGYVQRGIAAFPHGGDRGPWTATMAYEQDVARLRHGPVTDPELRFSGARTPSLTG